MGDKQHDLIRTFNEITGCSSVQDAKKLLMDNNWNLKVAVGVFFAKSSEGRSSNGSKTAPSITVSQSPVKKNNNSILNVSSPSTNSNSTTTNTTPLKSKSTLKGVTAVSINSNSSHHKHETNNHNHNHNVIVKDHKATEGVSLAMSKYPNSMDHNHVLNLSMSKAENSTSHLKLPKPKKSASTPSTPASSETKKLRTSLKSSEGISVREELMGEIQRIFSEFDLRLKHLERHLYTFEQNSVGSTTFVQNGNKEEESESEEEEEETEKETVPFSPRNSMSESVPFSPRNSLSESISVTENNITVSGFSTRSSLSTASIGSLDRNQSKSPSLDRNQSKSPSQDLDRNQAKSPSHEEKQHEDELLFSAPEETTEHSSSDGRQKKSKQESIQSIQKKAAYYEDEHSEEAPNQPLSNSPILEDCLWNSKFQKVMDEMKTITSNTPLETKIRIYSELSGLAQDFNFMANSYAKIIISEVGIPHNKKTIKPIDIGGQAGGEKYLVNSILFKFAVDINGILNYDEDRAAKMADNDLKGLISYFNCGMSEVCFPITSIIDWHGFRIIAQAKLPINGSTLVYGSSDGGTESFSKHPTLASLMKDFADKLNLKSHLEKNGTHNLYSATDLEGHVGLDGRLYLVDFARSMPPQTPDSKIKGSAFFLLLRPELVRRFKKPLNPDSCSSFCHEKSREEDDLEIEEATDFLCSAVVPSFAAHLDQLPRKDRGQMMLLSAMHAKGINFRYMGLLRAHTTDSYFKGILLLEMISRSIKVYIRRLLRQEKRWGQRASVQAHKLVIISILNLTLGTHNHGGILAGSGGVSGLSGSGGITNLDYKGVWRNIKELIQQKFPLALTGEEMSGSSMLLEKSFRATSNPKGFVFQKLTKMLGLRWEREQAERYQDPAAFSISDPFDVIDLVEVVECVKQINIVALAQGYVLKTRLSSKPENSSHIIDSAIAKLHEALQSMPENKLVLCNLADLFKTKGESREANRYYIEALESDPEDVNILTKYASFLNRSNQLDLAESYFQKALKFDESSVFVLQEYVDFLIRRRQDFVKSELLCRRAVDLYPEKSSCLHNWALYLMKYKKNYEEADKYFARAIEVDGNNPLSLHVKNYIWFLKHLRGNTQKAEELSQKFLRK